MVKSHAWYRKVAVETIASVERSHTLQEVLSWANNGIPERVGRCDDDGEPLNPEAAAILRLYIHREACNTTARMFRALSRQIQYDIEHS